VADTIISAKSGDNDVVEKILYLVTMLSVSSMEKTTLMGGDG
jgi:hypothetical protein